MSDDPNTARNFGQILATLQDGKMHADLSDASRDLIARMEEAAINAGGKSKGKLTITLDYKVEGGVVEIMGDFAVKAPKLARGRSIFWMTPENNLTRRNPAQPDLPFRDVSVPAARNLA